MFFLQCVIAFVFQALTANKNEDMCPTVKQNDDSMLLY